MWEVMRSFGFALSIVGIPCGVWLTCTRHPWYVWALVTLAQLPNFLWGIRLARKHGGASPNRRMAAIDKRHHAPRVVLDRSE